MSPRLEITTTSGAVAGAMADPAIRVFRGIPYAKPPVGPLRWRPPEACPPWSGVRDATHWSPDCPQTGDVGSRAPGQGEDCLCLNIWTPAAAEPGSLPVMVWIHGGSFVAGSGAESRLDGAKLAADGVVVITINYRVGLFGFLAHPHLTAESPHGSSGNYGLMDQALALQWVRTNIAAFGGDPARVTAFGVSAGSASISLLMVSRLGRGMFDRAILQSPGAARRLASLAEAEEAGCRLGADIGALRQLSAADVLARTSLLAPAVRGLTTPRVLRPIRDGWVIAEDERPAFKAGRLHVMPILVGTNLDEGTEATAGWPIATLPQYHELLRTNFGPLWGEALHRYPAATDGEVRMRVAELFADTQFNYGTRLLAQAMVRSGAPVWRYLFTRRRAHRLDGPHHGQEVHYVFGNLDASYPGELPSHDATDETLSLAMRRAWVGFAVGADPNGPDAPEWPGYDPRADNGLEFGDTVTPRGAWRNEQLDFLERYFEGGAAPGN